MSDLADDLYQAYKAGRTTLRLPEPDFTGLTTPDLFRHIADEVAEKQYREVSGEQLNAEWNAGYEAGQHDARSERW